MQTNQIYFEIEKQIKIKTDEEAKNQLINDAKIRAIKEASSYEEFKNIVQTAHLKPLHRQDIRANNSSNWNIKFNKESFNFKTNNPEKSLDDITNFNHQEIIRFWRNLNSKQRFDTLKEAKRQNVISSWLRTLETGEILMSLSFLEDDNDTLTVNEILDELSKKSRFNLELKMLSEDEKQTVKCLLQQIEHKIKKKIPMYSSLWH